MGVAEKRCDGKAHGANCVDVGGGPASRALDDRSGLRKWARSGLSRRD